MQGLTLRPLLGRLRLIDNDPVGQEFEHARVAAYGAALASFAGDPSPEAEVLRREYDEKRESRGEGCNDGRQHLEEGTSERVRESYGVSLRRRAIEAARREGHAMRERGEVGDAAYRRLEQELDWAELSATPQSVE
ncbi:MAG: hypothetical protein ACR2GP_16395 [Burkholderiaceae bacterium]